MESVQISSGPHKKPSAALKLLFKGKPLEIVETGVGPVDAVFHAINKLTKLSPKLVDYSIQAITGGTDAQGEVTVRIKDGETIYVGHGASMDIILASAKAYLAAINRLLFNRNAG